MRVRGGIYGGGWWLAGWDLESESVGLNAAFDVFPNEMASGRQHDNQRGEGAEGSLGGGKLNMNALVKT